MYLMRKVFELDRRIRYCGVLDKMGRLTSGGMRPGANSLEPKDEAQRVDVQVVVTRGMTELAKSYLGRTNYVIIHREKVMFIALPRRDGKTVLVSTEPDFPLGQMKALVKVVDENYPR